MNAYDIKFQIYANDEREVELARKAIIAFIADMRVHGRAVTGERLASILPRWKENVLVRNKILDYFKPNKQ